jgi:hypothetical protein
MPRPRNLRPSRPGRGVKGAPTGPDFNLREGLRAAAPKRAAPKAARASTAGYRTRAGAKGGE